MKLELDENVGQRGAAQLTAVGHDVATIAAEGLCRATDRELARACRTEGRCLVTLDLEFGNPLVFNPSEYPGIAVIRLRGRPEPADLDRALCLFASGLEAGAITGKLWIVEPTRLREYQPET